ncbi:uncharacterized protein LOC142605973 [Castanea sativa]|uniref:uncharacterized protein LOC142605973 n=1 Tax=Castanea sativa TaxID=21020 RepID=UPI003F65050C
MEIEEEATNYMDIDPAVLILREERAYWELAAIVEATTKYGVPHEIISDNGLHFKGEAEKLLRKLNIQYHKSSPYHLQTNGVVEAANKNIGRILQKSTKNYKDWMKVVIAIEMGVHSLRIVLESEIPEVDWMQSRYD